MNTEKKIQDWIVDDYNSFLEGLKKCLASDGSLEVIAEAENGSELISEIEKKIPDVIIMDLKMPVMDGKEATQIIKKKFPAIRILVLTMYGEEEFISRLMDMGANGYLLKNAEPEEIRRSVYAVHENGFYFNDSVNRALLKKLIAKNYITPAFNRHIDLSPLDRQVLKLICEEKNTEEIAQEIQISSARVSELREQLAEKIGVRNIAGLVMYAIKNGIAD